MFRLLKPLLRRRAPTGPTAPIYPLPEQKALYFSTPKVACTTWLRMCCRLQGVDLATVPAESWFSAIPKVTLREVSERRFKGWYRFGFVRNPWDRLVSCYLNKIQPEPTGGGPDFRNGIPMNFERFGVFRAGMSFEEFARAVTAIPDREADSHFASQHLFFPRSPSGEIELDFVGRFERSNEDFALVKRRLGVATDTPHDKRTRGRDPYAGYYDETLRELIRQRFAEDVRLFGYEF